MILPFDPNDIPDDAVEQLVASGAYTRAEAEGLLELLRADDLDPDFMLE